ncbi:uncharacterized protein LOC111375832 [Olea europaea var. sylvestris]|uniref:uncharacterized protein LOC111375832 n=1 Tax=Olea europaea var. sylvestris TaxID=158386 RepID=UPI000C1CCFC7|nr:uncharacterized protein LOC111375832 [Olea europaea var. sylvestris]
MATFAAGLSRSPLHLPTIRPCCRISPARPFSVIYPTAYFIKSRSLRTLVLASSASSSGGEFNSRDGNSRSKKSVLSNLIQEIEPLDVSLIQKDVPPTTIDAMKRTISGMLGLLPSDQFQVMIEALWEPLSKLLISSMMTGYTLRNAEFRLCVEKNLEIHKGHIDKQKAEDTKLEAEGLLLNDDEVSKFFRQDNLPLSETNGEVTSQIPDLGEISLEAREYILRLQSRLSSVRKELHEVKRKSAALQMQQFVGEEKNDLLDYLRSLQPEKVAELSEPSSPELKDTVHSVVHGLLATLSPKMHSKASDLSDNPAIGTIIIETKDCIDVVENTSLQFQPLISLTRDYLARLLFWCMLLGHYLRGLEYRLELMELLSLPCVEENGTSEE